jgi:ubiquinone biosynthesis accessory factor UbiJ
MLHTLTNLMAPAMAERLTLVFNHVLGSEVVATERLRPHAGRRLELQLAGWPSLLPAPPPLAWRITPAGLLEWVAPGGTAESVAEGVAEPVDLSLVLEASNPALLVSRVLAGEPPPVQIDGDARLAGDVNWLVQNLRWDLVADLERLFGPVVAQQLGTLGRALAGGLRTAVQGASALGERLRPRAS